MSFTLTNCSVFVVLAVQAELYEDGDVLSDGSKRSNQPRRVDDQILAIQGMAQDLRSKSSVKYVVCLQLVRRTYP